MFDVKTPVTAPEETAEDPQIAGLDKYLNREISDLAEDLWDQYYANGGSF